MRPAASGPAVLLAQPAEQRRRDEEGAALAGGDEREQLGRVEAAGRRQHLGRAPADEGEAEEAGGVAQRRDVQERVARADRVHVGVVRGGHRQEVSVRQPCALGAPGRARREEDPRVVVEGARDGGSRLGSDQRVVVRVAEDDHPRLPGKVLREPGREVGAREADARPARLDELRCLARMELGVDRDCDRPRVPDREQRLEVFGAVPGEQHDPVARSDAERRAQPCAPSRDRLGERAPRLQRPLAEDDRRLVGRPPRRPVEQRAQHRAALRFARMPQWGSATRS